MLQSSRFKRIYIACGYTDLRYGIDGLAATVRERFNLNPFETDILFLFCGRRNDRIKALVWEGDGFLLLYKRLEDGKFKWPRKTEDLEEISEEQFRWLLTGLDVNPGIRKVVRRTGCYRHLLFLHLNTLHRMIDKKGRKAFFALAKLV